MEIITELIESFNPASPNFRPTEIYNENWLLKAFLHQASQTNLDNSPISFAEGSTWFSEALLPTAFQARYRGDPLAESRTNADGVIGHILIGEKAKADLELAPDAKQFVVIEAKIGSPLSPGIRNAPNFDQAARNVACMAEVLRRAEVLPQEVEDLAFIVLAPQVDIESGKFTSEMDFSSMKGKVLDRVRAYGADRNDWYEKWGAPTLAAVSLHSVSWEQAIQALEPDTSKSLNTFYASCLRFN